MNAENDIYPIGKLVPPLLFTEEVRKDLTKRIEVLPERLEKLSRQLSDRSLNHSYRESGWNARQIIHHLADSHMNAYLRFKLALTEENPVIKPYNQDAFALFNDAQNADISTSMILLEKLHIKWVDTIYRMKTEAFDRTYMHPEYNKITTLNQALALYAWHGDHHFAQIEVIIKKYP